MLKWRQDLMFEQRFRSDDDKSENKIRESIDGMVEQFVEKNEELNNQKQLDSQLPLLDEDDLSLMKNKDLKIAGTIYSVAYYGFINENKKKY